MIVYCDGNDTRSITSGTALIKLVFEYFANGYRIESVICSRGMNSLLQYEIALTDSKSTSRHSFRGNSIAMTPLIRAASLFDEYKESPFGEQVTRMVWGWRRGSEKFYELEDSGVDSMTSLALVAAGYVSKPDSSPGEWKKERVRAVIIGLVDDDSSSTDTQTLFPSGYPANRQ